MSFLRPEDLIFEQKIVGEGINTAVFRGSGALDWAKTIMPATKADILSSLSSALLTKGSDLKTMLPLSIVPALLTLLGTETGKNIANKAVSQLTPKQEKAIQKAITQISSLPPNLQYDTSPASRYGKGLGKPKKHAKIYNQLLTSKTNDLMQSYLKKGSGLNMI